MSAGDDRFARLALAAGAVVGIVLAAVGIVRSGGPGTEVSPGAIAVVNGQPIQQEAFARFAAAVAAERKTPELDLETRRRLLDRLIDEELLLQRGVGLDLHRFEPTARRAIVSALVASVTADAELVEPDEETLRAFHAENAELFTRPGRLSLAVAFVSVDGRADAAAFRRAEEISRRVRGGEALDAVRREAGDPMIVELPEGPLPIETVRQYLGPTVAQAAMRLGVGEVSAPMRGSPGYYVLELRGRKPGEVAPFEEMREPVRGEYLRSRGNAALREYLEELRASAEVRVLDAELGSERDRP